MYNILYVIYMLYTHTHTHIYIYIYIYIVYHNYLSISLHGETLTKWNFDLMESSLCAAYITELIYFSPKITQNITIKS